MLVLAIDTATKIGSVALYDDKIGVIGELNIYVKINHSAVIMSMIDNLFKMTKLTINDVDRIAITVGPGSFTGIRIGVAVAKGLCYGTEKSIVGINELDLLANNIEGFQGEIVSLIDARKERVYYSIYEKNSELKRVSDYKDGEIRELLESLKGKTPIFCGDGAIAYESIIKEILGEDAKIVTRANSIPRAVIAGQLSITRTEDNIYTLEPFYVNKSQAEREREERLSKNC
ncbi:tRNA (adenosine(37)-N6)-threonylcarbamoyltransferase complex dimerization subunit type 1 TsaB [Fusobacterium sp. SYSU M8A802]